MYALLLAAAVLVGGSIWYACSADDEFESNYEMETLANSMKRLAGEPVVNPIYVSSRISTGFRIGMKNPTEQYEVNIETDTISYNLQSQDLRNFQVRNPTSTDPDISVRTCNVRLKDEYDTYYVFTVKMQVLRRVNTINMEGWGEKDVIVAKSSFVLN